MNKKALVAITVLSILVLPTVLYLLFTHGEHNFIAPPYYGPRKAITVEKDGKTKTDTAYHTVPPFTLTDQNGRPFNSSALAGKIYIAAFLSSTGGPDDNRMATLLQNVQERIINDHRIKGKGFAIVTFSTTPQTDSATVLNAYAKRLNADPGIWTFLTGPADTINMLGREGYLLNELVADSLKDNAYKGHKFLLVDKEGHIRGQCTGTILMEVNKMVEDIKVLYAWYARPKKGQKNIQGVEQRRD